MASTSRQKRSGNFIHHCVTPRFPKRNLAKKNARRGEVYLDEYSLPSAVHTLHVRHDRDDRSLAFAGSLAISELSSRSSGNGKGADEAIETGRIRGRSSLEWQICLHPSLATFYLRRSRAGLTEVRFFFYLLLLSSISESSNPEFL